MILRKVVAKNTTEALRRVERELGADALIVETRHEQGLTTVIARKAEPKQARRTPKRSSAPTTTRYPRAYQDYADQLTEQGLSERLIDILHRALDGLDPLLIRRDSPSLPVVLTRVLTSLIPCRSPKTDRISVLVGPTGVGKTTTLAKMLSKAVLEDGQRCIVLTLDSFRVGAAEQLRSFAEVLDVPFHMAFQPGDLQRLLAEFGDCDRIFVDTTGRSPRDSDSIATMAEALAGIPSTPFLCLPASARRKDLELAFEAFAALEARHLILTKWDETLAPGEALSFAIERGMPMTWITDGQRVPEDIHRARSQDLAREAILGGKA